MYLLMAIIAVVVSFSVAGAWFVDRDTVDSTMDMGGAVIVKLVGTGEDGTIQNFKQLYDSDGGAYPGDKILDSIKVQMGEKTEESVLRVQYSVNILDEENNVKTENLTEAETNLVGLLRNDLKEKTTLYSSDWTPTSGEWIYYKHLASGKTKPIDLFDEYSLPIPDSEMDNQYQELSFRILLVAEAIQAANILSNDEWNDDITNLSDSALMERVIKYNAERFADIDEVLPYIENSGTQYINTEYYWKTDNVRAVLSANIITHNQAQSLFGNEEYIGSDRYFALIPHNSGGTMKIFSLNRNLVNFSYPLSTDIILDVSATKQNTNNYVNLAITANQTTTNYGGKATTDGSVITNPNKLDSGVGQIYLFANHNSGRGAVNGTTTPNMNGIQIVSKMRVYSFKMYDDGELVRCFVPARDKDGNVGLYDIVTKKMYLNQGSGSFSYGHSITYVANGGTLDPSKPKTFVSSDLPITLPVPTRAGYEFGGWFLSSDFSGMAQTTIPAGTDNNVYLYAKWIKTYDINYHLGGGVNSASNPAAFSEKTLPVTLSAPTREGFVFAGWYQNPTFSGSQVTTIETGTEKNVSLWAKWNAIEYSISYVLNGGTNSDQNVAKYSILDTPVKLYNPIRDGYLFEGWFASSDFSGGRVTYLSKEGLGDVTLYAKWSTAYTITYNTNGGLNDGRNPSVFTENTETFTLFEAEKVNYSFIGWFDNEEFTGTPITQIAKGTKNNIVLWAKWNSAQITVTFDANGGGVSPLTKVVKKDETYGELPTPSRPGYTFDGWFEIPAEYQKVEYLYFSGAQYINTGFVPTADTAVEVAFNTSTDGKWIFGSRTAYQSKDTYALHLYTGSNAIWFQYAGTGPSQQTVSAYSGKKTTLKVDKDYMYVNGNKINSTAFGISGYTNGTLPMFLGEINNNGSKDGRSFVGNIYSFKVWNGNTLVRDFVPVVRKSDSVAGMYDRVEGKFYSNAGSGSFTVGQASQQITSETTLIKDVDHTLYAHWTEEIYSITYNLDGGTNAAGNPATFTCSSLPISLSDATKTGLYFAGWYTDSAFTSKRLTQIAAGTLKNVKLWARFSSEPLVFDLVGTSAYSVSAANSSISGDIVIPSTYDGKSVVVIQNHAFANCKNITSIQIPSTVKSLGINAFENCSKLTSITIPDGVTFIPNNAFVGCSSLASVDIPESVESIGANAFAGCTQLSSIVLPSKISEIGANAFGETNQYGEEIAMTSEFWTMANYSGRTSSSFETGGAYSNYAKIVGYQQNESIDTAWRIEMQNAINVVGGKTYTISFYVKATNWATSPFFRVNTGGWDSLITWSTGTQGLPKQLNFASDGQWHRIEFSVTAPAGATTMKIRLGMDTPNFYGVDSSLEIAHFVISKPQTLDVVEVFGDTPATLKTGVFPSSVSKIYVKPSLVATYKAAWAEYKNKIVGFTEYSITYNLNGGTNSTKNISSFTKIDVPIKLYDPTKENADFLGWYATSDFSGEKVTEITTASNITLYARWDRKMTITYVLNGGKNNAANLSIITESMLPYTLMPADKDNYTFIAWFLDDALTNQISSITNFGDITIYAAWEELNPYLVFTLNTDNTAYSVKASSTGVEGAIKIPSIHRGKPVTTIEPNAFANCSKMTDLFIPSSVTSIGSSAFSNCSGDLLICSEVISKPNGWSYEADIYGVKYLPTSNNEWKYVEKLDGTLIAVKYLGNSTNVKIPNSIDEKNVFQIYNNCFKNKSSIISIEISNNITDIGSNAFYNCSSMRRIYIPISVTTISTSSSSYSPFYGWNSSAVIYCGAGSKPSGWGNYWNYYGSSSQLKVVWNVTGFPQQNEDWEYVEKTDGTIRIVKYLGSSSIVTIPSILSSKSVSEIYSSCFANKTAITSVTIPNSVTNIGGAAFYNCSGLTSIAIPSSVTSIGINAFYNCTALTSIDILNGVTSIGENAFENCTSMRKIYIPISVTTISASIHTLSPFYGWDNSAVIYCGASSEPSGWGIGWRCYESSGSTSSLLPTVWGVAGYPQQNSEWEYIEKIDGTIRVEKYIGSATDVTVPSTLSGKTVNEIYNYCFKDNTAITSVAIPSSVTSIGISAFYGCSKLTSITIPNSVTSIGSSAFYGCSGLTSITIPNSVTSIGSSAFSGCSGLTSITIPFVGGSSSSNTYLGYIFGASSYSGNSSYVPSSLKTVVVTNGSSIPGSAFYDCSKLTSITIPSSVTSIGNKAFQHCTSMTKIYIPSSVTTISASSSSYSPFYGWNSSAVIYCGAASKPSDWGSYWNYYNSSSQLKVVWNIAGFEQNSEWEYLEKNDGTIGVLKYLGSEVEVAVPSTLSGKTVSEIYGGCFENNATITSVTIQDSVTNIGNSAFYNCSGLTSVTMGSSVTSIGDSVFSGCKGLTSISIPNGVTSIGNYAFYNCSGLTSINIPDGVTSIGVNAFGYCTGLTKIYIPASVTTITTSNNTSSPFYGCKSSLKIYCGASSKPSGWGQYWNYYKSSGSGGNLLSVTWGASGLPES